MKIAIIIEDGQQQTPEQQPPDMTVKCPELTYATEGYELLDHHSIIDFFKKYV